MVDSHGQNKTLSIMEIVDVSAKMALNSYRIRQFTHTYYHGLTWVNGASYTIQPI